LLEILEGLGLTNIETYIQSGNVVFQSDDLNASELSERIGLAINENHGFTPQVLLLELDELKRAIASNPFAKAEAEPKSLHVFFLASEPQDPDLKALESIRADSERFALKGKVFYLHTPDGIGKSKLAARVEKALGVAATARNWRSVSRIMAMAQR
jgi:uncharacterized protein (DUF1697 family)